MDQQPSKADLEQQLKRVKQLAAEDPDGDQFDEKIAEMEKTINSLPPDMGQLAPPRHPIVERKIREIRAKKAAANNERKRLLKARRKKDKRAGRR